MYPHLLAVKMDKYAPTVDVICMHLGPNIETKLFGNFSTDLPEIFSSSFCVLSKSATKLYVSFS